MRPGITASNSPATAWLACACTLPASAGAGGAALSTTLTSRLRRTIAVFSVVFTFESRVPFVSGAMSTAAVAALYWLARTSKTAVGGEARAGPTAPPLEGAVIQPPVPAARRWDTRTAARARRTNFCVRTLPASAGGGGAFAMRYLAPAYERRRYRRDAVSGPTAWAPLPASIASAALASATLVRWIGTPTIAGSTG